MLEGKSVDLDFSALERMKQSATVEDIVSMFEAALKSAQ